MSIVILMAQEMHLINGTFEWVELGPAHSQKEIDDLLADDRLEIEPKTVDETGYFPESHGDNAMYYLQITGYTSNPPDPLECPDLTCC